MKNYLKISIILFVFGSFFLSCTPNDVTDGDIPTELNEEQANGGRKKKREDPANDN